MSTTAAPTKTAKRRAVKRKPRTTVGAPVASSFGLTSLGTCGFLGLGTWGDYLALDKAFENRGYRVRYLDGQLEIMSISFEHDWISRQLAALVMAVCEVWGIEYNPWGSTTQSETGKAGGEPDESFSFGETRGDKPDLLIEVALTSGGIDKLKFWETLGATEVWVWQDDRLQGFAREDGNPFAAIKESKHLPGLKLAMIEAAARVQPTSKAVREFKAKLAELQRA